MIEDVRKRLRSGEYSIYERTGGFDFSDRSIVGTHTLYISNQGTVYAHDTGGIFGSERTVTYDAQSLGVKVSPSSYFMTLSNTAPYHALRFSFTVDFNEFTKMYALLPRECFQWDADDFCLYKKESETAFLPGKIKVTDTMILLSSEQGYPSKKYELPMRRIRTVEEVSSSVLKINGQFAIDEQACSSFELFLPQKEIVTKLAGHKGRSVFDVVGNDAELYPVYLELSGKPIPLTLAHSEDKLSLVNENSLQVIKTFSKTQDSWYYNKQDQLAIVLGEKPFVFVVEEKRTEAFFTKNLYSDQHRLLVGTYLLNGTWLGIPYEQEQVAILSTKNGVQFFSRSSLALSEAVSLHNSVGIVDVDKLIVKHDFEGIAQICMLQAEGQYDFAALALPFSNPSEHAIGYDDSGQPFWFIHGASGVTFFSTSEKHRVITNEDIQEISVVEREEDSLFTAIQICTKKEKKRVSVPTTSVGELIQKTYLHAKAPLVQTVPVEQLYLSYARHSNDYLSYDLFGQLFAIQEGIREITATNANRDFRNLEMINFLYYAIQSQKRRLDTVSIYLPAFWEREDRALFPFPVQQQPYRQLQRNLTSLSAQIRHSLSEVENALSAVSSFIILKKDMDEFIKEKTKRGRNAALAVGGIGLALAPLTGGISLVLPGVFMGINTYMNAADMKRIEELKQSNENLRLDFFMRKALDAYEHFMSTLVPYYVSEMNQSVTSFFQELAVPYQGVLGDPSVKQKLLGRMAEYYTFKQLPIDDSVLTKKEALVETVQGSLSLADEHMQIFKQEVTYHVPESVAVPKLSGK
ncbi:hypothetical protein P9G84_11785 [Brevibacillus centrosporus]|uniref:hypothetical protein n=1 Tax=Brevibacillus centrosporus TaxID=54910 RepID=UPI000F09A727|nr:hypothetical protein [Brevibacillus centrosporus]MEC2129651.1 hypothetical protein [Brevibacillus centrosporus]RNB65751.1 hypothetical protein EDM55_24220 [Brevibacillus centrosporus]GED30010.1 hypothetical protein BCE02nite_11510 [Brevibacillus centrosporus]